MDFKPMPVEDYAVSWGEARSPYSPVARLVVGPQDAYGHKRRVFAGDRIAFSPWNGLTAHRPLGHVMRARQVAYERLSAAA